jgi:hypothetical protein
MAWAALVLLSALSSMNRQRFSATRARLGRSACFGEVTRDSGSPLFVGLRPGYRGKHSIGGKRRPGKGSYRQSVGEAEVVHRVRGPSAQHTVKIAQDGAERSREHRIDHASRQFGSGRNVSVLAFPPWEMSFAPR